MHMVTALFPAREDAESVISWLRERGYRDDEIGVVVDPQTMQSPLAKGTAGEASEEQTTGKAEHTAKAGVGIVAIATLAGLALTVGTGGLAFAGPLALLIGGVSGAAVGGIATLLPSAGIPPHDANRYADELKRGATLISVVPHEGDVEAVKALFARVSVAER